MPLFMCSKCGCVENTALSHYWQAGKVGALCSECDPAIGQWHGRFPKRSAAGMLVDQNGHLWSREAVDTGQLPQAYKIVGEVVQSPEAMVEQLTAQGRDMGFVVMPSQLGS